MGRGKFDRELRLALRAAFSSGKLLTDYYTKIISGAGINRRYKGEKDLVSEADTASEALIRKILSRSGIPVLGEEFGGEFSNSFWAVDPLDGTKNFVHGVPVFAVSIALFNELEPVVGVVHLPWVGETFYAVKGGGAYYLGRKGIRGRLRIKDISIKDAVGATGFPHRKSELLKVFMDTFERIFPYIQAMRRLGAAAVDLAYVGAGRFHIFWQLGINIWDFGAGMLIVREAGGRVTDFMGRDEKDLGEDFYRKGMILAAPPSVHSKALEILSEVDFSSI